MDVDQIYSIIKFAVAKNVQQGYVSPQEFNDVLMPTAQKNYLDYLLGEFQKYQIQRPISVVEFGQNERVRNAIAPLIYGAILNPFPYSGISPYPSDFIYPDAMWGIYGHYNIRFVQQDELDSYVHSGIDPIAENPVYVLQWEGIHFFPETIGQTRMSYVRNPPPIVWASIPDSNGVPQYDPINSQQPVWGESDIYQIIVRALALVGVNLQYGVVMQYANDIKNGGQ